MARVLGYVLTVGTAEAWTGFATVALARMTVAELACLAKAALIALIALIALPDDVADMVWGQRTGQPLPTFLSLMDDARCWASNATRREKKAYQLATWEEMAESDRADFLRYINTKRDAAP